MNTSKHWFVCLDLSQIDEIIIQYVEFLAKKNKPETISFLHVVESSSISDEMRQLFPELGSNFDLNTVIREDLQQKIDENIDLDGVETRLILKEGHPTDQIINIIKTMDPDLLILGKKGGYEGEGVLARKIIKYVPCSVLFVPETSRYSLDTALVPIDYSRQSARAIESAVQLTGAEGQVIAHHILRYHAHFFPYIPTDDDKEKIYRHLDKKEASYKDEYEISEEVEFVKTLYREGKIGDKLYNEVVLNQADILVIATKGNKKLTSLLREDFVDKVLNYAFGIPVFVLKNKKSHQKYLDAFS